MKKTGFTLTEAIIVIVALAIIVAASVPFIAAVLDAWVFSKAERDMVFGGRLALNRMVREIRQIKNSTG
ncbi:MAG: prepilin-type N-terminal cleavage/methylation domain-containing protein, partial [Candidatus Omnitrophica bacterium]|nr:prepilin-type N-terminal cleavage/methylation domain-containing protein [Candidatus Omnitrophota bacterium]